MADATKQYSSLLQKLSCGNAESTAECLRLVGANTLFAHSPGTLLGGDLLVGWKPTVDGVALTAAPTTLIARKQYNNRVPVIVGSNRDEAAFFFLLGKLKPLAPANLGALGYSTLMGVLGLKTGESQSKLNRLYNPRLGEPGHNAFYGDGDYEYPPADKRGCVDMHGYNTSKLIVC